MSPLDMPKGLTVTERHFYRLLSDGKPHSAEELTKYLWDEEGLNLRSNVYVHICNLRKKLPETSHIYTTTLNKIRNYILSAAIHTTS